ncbi:unnamed protein product [Microthlaspi erraticum]|uniref:Uncharacterized protein n=1 Tax=Microthlaspi erraticum TaxID=1685480 RepID=A0A6D2JKA2_9BRAS|nr:unnamed protein product [Microthlaspi erraticum]
MDKMVSKIKSLEKKVSGSSSKKKKSKLPLSLGVSLLTTPRRLPAQEPHRASSFEPREGEDNTQRRRKSSKARRSSSTTGLDRAEETQLDRAEGRVDLEEPLFEDPGFDSTKAKEATHFQDEEEEEEEPQARSSEPNPVAWSAPDGRLPSPDHDLVSQFFGGTEAKFGGANSSSIELGVKTRKVVFWSILEHMGHEEHGGTWHMEAAQLDTQRKKGEAILKTSSTVYSTNRSKLDRPSFNSIELRSQQSNPKIVASPLTFL